MCLFYIEIWAKKEPNYIRHFEVKLVLKSKAYRIINQM